MFRVVYHCSGHCRHGHTSSDSDHDRDFEDVDAEGYTDVESDSSTGFGSDAKQPDKSLHSLSMPELNKRLNDGSTRKHKRPAQHKCDVVLHVSLFAFFT